MTRRPSRPRLTVQSLEDRAVPAAGELDPTFGTGGTVLAPALRTGQANAVAVYPADAGAQAGKIVAVGQAGAVGSSFYQFAVERFTPAGTPDTTFGSGGLATTAFTNASAIAHDGAVLPNGKVLAAGFAIIKSSPSTDSEFALARFNADGTLDTTFGGRGKGKVTADFGSGQDAAEGLVVQPDGKIVLVGSATLKDGSHALALVRYTADGLLDPTFDGDGKVTLAGAPGSGDCVVAVQGTDKLVVAAHGGSGIVLARFRMSDGGLDTTFGTGGWVDLPVGLNNYDENSMMAVGPDGRIVLTGYALNAIGVGNDVFVARLTPDGAPDTTFGTQGNGVVYSDFGASEQAFGVAVQPQDGKVVLAGRRGVVGGTVDFLTVRYDAAGQLDPTWNSNGPIPGAAWTDFNGTYDAANAVAIQPDGKVVLAGRNNNGSVDVFALARYQGDTPPAALTAAGGAVDGSTAKSLSTGALRPIVAEAVRRWNATGLTAAERRLLRHVHFQIADLDGATLGLAAGNTVTLDRDAAGYGWFVDRTPRRDTEFAKPGDQGEQAHMDLLTVVLHELGHVLGRDHAGSGLMAETLATGARLTPASGE